MISFVASQSCFNQALKQTPPFRNSFISTYPHSSPSLSPHSLSKRKKERKKYNLAWINDEPAWPITSTKCSPAGSSSHKALSDVGLAKRAPPSQAHNPPGSRLRGSSFPISSCQTDWLLRTANWVTELSSSWPPCLVPTHPSKKRANQLWGCRF